MSRLIPLALLAAAAFLAPTAGDAAPDAARGKAAYMKVGCFQCHGTVGQGAITGPKIAPGALPYAGFEFRVRSPTGQMPAYPAGLLPAEELQDIHTYLVAQPPAKSAKDLGLTKLLAR